ncbi:diaminopimelate decarboxylase [Leptolyngbya sp. PCC 7375]|nr:diaminopimelate decarboxylase [Leptolyngbya sp. PCC 7375]
MPKTQAKRLVRSIGAQALQKRVGMRQDLSPQLWNMSYENSALTLHGVNLQTLLEQYGSPLHVLNTQKLEQNAHAMMYGHQKQQILNVYYSYKTHPIPRILQLLHSYGVGAEVISPYELWLALHLGVDPQKIIYNGPAKSDESIEIAIDRGIRLLNVNHREELERFAKISQQVGKKANIAIRLIFAKGWSGQFGLGVDTGEALATYRQALSMPELNVIGVHCHRGVLFDGLDDVAGYLQGIKDFLNTLYQEFNFHPEILDVGGSIAIPTVRSFSDFDKKLSETFRIEVREPTPQEYPTLEDFAEFISKDLTGYFQDVNRPVPELAVEPGRAITGNTQALLSRIVDTKETSEAFTYGILDAGISVAEIVKYEFHQVFPLQQKAQTPEKLYRLVGPICHMGDTLYPAWRLPELAKGDAIAIMDSGAYFVPEARAFSFPKPGIVGLNSSGESFMIRKSDTFESIIHMDCLAD